MDNSTNNSSSDVEILTSNDLIELAEELSRKEQEVPSPSAENEAEVEKEDVDEEADQSYEEGLEDGITISSDFADYKSDSIIEKREGTRSRLALIYTILTFMIFLCGMLIAVLDGLYRKVSIIDNLTEIIPLISGVFLGSLGFVLGYYFRKGDE